MDDYIDRIPYTILPPAYPDPQRQYGDRVADSALERVGVREEGHNRGALVEAWQALVGIDPGDPWCAAFVCAMHDEGTPAGYVTPLPMVGSANAIWRWAMNNPKKAVFVSWEDVVPGDIFVRGSTVDKAARIARGRRASGHTGIAVSRWDEARRSVQTVEGNTNLAGSREGQGVYERTQSPDEPRIVGWVRPLIHKAEW